MKRDENPVAASTVRAAYYSFRDALGLGDNEVSEVSFLAGAAWAFAKIGAASREADVYTATRLDELYSRLKKETTHE